MAAIRARALTRSWSGGNARHRSAAIAATLCGAALLGWGSAAGGEASPVVAPSARQAVTLEDTNVFPESITTTGQGDVIIGSVSQHFIYRAAPGSDVARRWIDLTAYGSASYGVLAEEKTGTLWVCTLEIPGTGRRPPNPAERHSALRAFDLRSGKPKGTWPLPGPTNSCNDVTIAPDGSAFVSDVINSRLLRLRRGAATFEVRYSGPETARVDGVAFIGREFYFTSLDTGGIYRLPDALTAKTVRPVALRLSEPLSAPDGMRSERGRLYVADNRLNKVVELTVKGDVAAVRVIRDGLDGPTGVAPRSGRIWIAEIRSHLWTEPSQANPGSFPFTVQSASIRPHP